MTYDEAVEYLSGLKRFGWKLSLDRMEALCAAFGNPEARVPCVHVGGTNGKGSTTAMVSSIARAAGLRTGLYISPFVVELRERIQVDGQYIPRHDFLRLMERAQPEVRRLATIPAIGQPTEFEVKTLLGFLHFAEREVDLSVLEVGLGGRLDATNVVTPKVSAITSIGLDHVDRLGGSLESIAWEKAGIIKPGVPCVAAAEGPALRVIEGVAREREAPLLRVGHEVLAEGGNGCLRVSVEGRPYGPFTLGLRGPFQRSNAAVAVAIAHLLRQQGWSLPDRALAQGLSDAYQPARMEVIQREPTVLLDGAHNLPAALALKEALAEGFPRRRLIIVLGMLRGHNAEDVLRQLEPLADRIILTAADAPRAADPEDLRQLLSRPDKAEVVLPVRSAYERALENADPEDLVLVTGSFYLMTEIPRPAAVCSIPASAAYAS